MKFEGARAQNFVGQIFFIPNLLYIGSQEAVKKIWSKIWIFYGSKVVERGKYSLLKCHEIRALLTFHTFIMEYGHIRMYVVGGPNAFSG
jgi:hypothetical protein